MADRLVVCGSAASSRRSGKALRLDLAGPDRNVELRLQDISKRMVTHVPDLLTDLLEVAAYVCTAPIGRPAVAAPFRRGWAKPGAAAFVL
jgi:hypothetical protein